MECKFVSNYCRQCGKELDESKAVNIPGATAEEELSAEVIRYSRLFQLPDDEDDFWGDVRYWCGECWRADPINMPQMRA